MLFLELWWKFDPFFPPQTWSHEAEPGGPPERRRPQRQQQLAACGEQRGGQSPGASMREQTLALSHFHSHFPA